MAIAKIEFDPKKLINEITELEKVILPNILYKSLNRAVFRTSREELKSAAKSTFIHRVPFTLNSFLYDKPKQTGNFLESRIFIRDDAPKGNAPANYLSPNMPGGSGTAYRTRFQRRLEAKGVLGAGKDEYMMPALRSVNKRSHLRKGEYTKALWGISAMNEIRGGFDYDKKQFKSAGSYIWIPNDYANYPDEFAEPRRSSIRAMWKKTTGHFGLPKSGIYKVTRGRLEQRFISLPDVPSGYAPKFDFEDIAKNAIERTFKEELTRNLKR